MLYCKKCGTLLDDDALFCHKCGTPVAITGEPISSGQQTPPATGQEKPAGTMANANNLYGRTDPDNLPEGYVIDERYKIIEKLGQGSFGAVYLAYDLQLEINKALKIIPEAVVRDKEAMLSLRKEAAIMVKLNHKNIVRVYDFHHTGGMKYIDMEYVEGKSLADLKLKKPGKKFTEKETKLYALQIAEGLSYAHRKKVIHKDIKPQNIMLSGEGEIKIMDFGIAETVHSSMSRLKNTGTSGTLVYMSPEQLIGENVGREADIYSLGATLYELLMGNPPFYQGDITYQIINKKPTPLTGVSPQMNSIVLKCLEKDRKQRFAGCEELMLTFQTGEIPLSSAKTSPQTHEEKSMYRANVQRTGFYPGKGVPVFHQVKWKFETGSAVVSSPAVSGGTVYVGSDDHYVYALDAATGQRKWKFKTGDGVRSSSALSGGTVYVGSGDGNVYALDAATGQLKWKFKTGNGVRSSSALSGGTVYVGSYDGYVYALDAATGQLKWKFETGNWVRSSPALSGGTVYVGSYDGYVYALDAATGQLKWKFKTGDWVRSSPALSGGTVYIGSGDGNVYALDAATGQLKWRFKTGDWVESSPAVSGGTVYVGSEDGYVYALDAVTGQLKWKFKTGDWVFSSPAVAGGTVYVGSYDHYVYALDAATGQPKWKFKTGSWIYSSPAVSGGTVYVGSEDGYVYAME